MIYSDVLTRLPVTSLRWYGLVPDVDFALSWVFVEHAHGRPYTPGDGVTAARWLARMHTSASCFRDSIPLPDTGARRYLEHLRSARHAISTNLGSVALTSAGHELLCQILGELDRVEEAWPLVEAVCGSTPVTLAHGDLKPDNTRIRDTQCGEGLFVFDWETAGWASPAVDLTLCGLDLAAYWGEAGSFWPGLTFAGFKRVAGAGRILRSLAAIDWESAKLGFPWLERVVRRMGYFRIALVEGMREAELST